MAIVVTSRYSSFEYTISVHAGVERNVCLLKPHKPSPIHLKRCSPCTNQHTYPAPLKVLTSKTPKPLAQLFTQMRFRYKYKVSSTGPNILEVYIIYLHGDMCQYMRFCHLWHVPRFRLAYALLKFHQNFHVLTHIDIYM